MEKVESECEKPPIPSPFKSALKSVAPYLAFACFVLLVLSILLFQPNQGYMSTGWVSLPILFLASFASFYAKWPLLFKKEKDKFKGDGARRFSFFRHLNMSVGLLAVFWLFFPLIGGLCSTDPAGDLYYFALGPFASVFIFSQYAISAAIAELSDRRSAALFAYLSLVVGASLSYYVLLELPLVRWAPSYRGASQVYFGLSPFTPFSLMEHTLYGGINGVVTLPLFPGDIISIVFYCLISAFSGVVFALSLLGKIKAVPSFLLLFPPCLLGLVLSALLPMPRQYLDSLWILAIIPGCYLIAAVMKKRLFIGVMPSIAILVSCLLGYLYSLLANYPY